MTHLVTPEMLLRIAGKEQVLSGCFTVLRDLQHSMKRDLLHIAASLVPEARVDELSEAISILTERRVSAELVGEWVLNEVGVLTYEYLALKMQIRDFLHVAMTPASAREKKRLELAEEAKVHRETFGPSSSLGENTSNSPLES